MHQQLDALLDMKLIVLSRTGRPKYKQYSGDGVVLQDIWSFQPGTEGTLYRVNHGIDYDVKWLDNEDEKLGYPTQKPVGLLQRLIEASSDVGHVVLDPFCGCGTAVHAAQKLGREWIGIDITHLAISLIEKRLNDAFPGIKYEVHGTPKDISGAGALAAQDKYQFQWWAVSLVNAVPFAGKKKGADSGIDGLIYFKTDSKTTERAIVSVKGGDNINVSMVRDLKGVLQREKAPIGIFITLAKPTQPMIAEAASAGFFECDQGKFERLQIFTVAELLKGAKPKLPLVDQSVAFKKAKKEGPDPTAQAKLL
jgi:site-specific DNA-methyltransferase (adenine-specific)